MFLDHVENSVSSFFGENGRIGNNFNAAKGSATKATRLDKPVLTNPGTPAMTLSIKKAKATKRIARKPNKIKTTITPKRICLPLPHIDFCKKLLINT